jgi:hypothetical protein
MWNFALSIFLGAFLLFQVQPLAGKYILPWFGGTPAVWSTCMLFFQTLLLGGYAYAHFTATMLKPRRQVIVHLSLLAVALSLMAWQWLSWGGPLLPDSSFKPTDSSMPAWRVLSVLAVSVGLPYVILSATGSLVQSWFARANPDRSPYRLYVLSNAGSLLALVSYPFLFEPALKLSSQASAWAISYAVFFAAMVWCGRAVWKTAGPHLPEKTHVGGCPAPDHASPQPENIHVGGCSTPDHASPQPENIHVGGCSAPDHASPQPEMPASPSWQAPLLWFGLAACGSSLLLAVTNQICQEVAVIPFLWVLPLTIYLLSFILVFAGDRWYSRRIWGVAFLVATVAAVIALFSGFTVNIILQVGVYSALLLCGCMVCHGEMVRLKPGPERLTAFYLLMSAGGAAGGMFVSLGAPFLFVGLWELHVSIWMAWLLFLAVLSVERSSWLNESGMAALRKVVAALLLVLACALYWHVRDETSGVLAASRNFYGTLRVRQMRWDEPQHAAYKLSHGAIVHGFQYASPARKQEPASYYAPGSGIALTIRQMREHRKSRFGDGSLRIAVFGLGVGTLAAFGEPGDYIRFYEINPDVTLLSTASNPYFTYLDGTPARWDVIEGDARIAMEHELARGELQDMDIIAMDAFSSDSIPIHLITREAIELYRKHLRPGGVMAIHISNRHLDLRPVIRHLAESFGLGWAIIPCEGDGEGFWSSTWSVVTDNREFLDRPAMKEAATDAEIGLSSAVWTDDFSNLFETLD